MNLFPYPISNPFWGLFGSFFNKNESMDLVFWVNIHVQTFGKQKPRVDDSVDLPNFQTNNPFFNWLMFFAVGSLTKSPNLTMSSWSTHNEAKSQSYPTNHELIRLSHPTKTPQINFPGYPTTHDQINVNRLVRIPQSRTRG